MGFKNCVQIKLHMKLTTATSLFNLQCTLNKLGKQYPDNIKYLSCLNIGTLQAQVKAQAICYMLGIEYVYYTFCYVEINICY